MRARRALVLSLLLGALAGGGLAARERTAPPRPVPPLALRGVRAAGVEVFAADAGAARVLAERCQAVHDVCARLLGAPRTHAAGLRVHVFPTQSAFARYTAAATGTPRTTAAFLRARGERLVLLHSRTDPVLVQHEVAHDALLQAWPSAPRWVAEGLALHLEAYAPCGGRLRWRPQRRWAERFLRLRAAGRLPATADAERLLAGARDEDEGAYARAWASLEALLWLRAAASSPRSACGEDARNPEGPAPDPRPSAASPPAGEGRGPQALAALADALARDPGFDALGAVVARRWAAPERRAGERVGRALAAPPERADLLLSLAERALWPLGRFAACSQTGGSKERAFAERRLLRAVADASRLPSRSLRAAATLCELPAPAAEDFERLARSAAALGLERTAAWARARARGAAHPAHRGREEGTATDTGPRVRSRSWDSAALAALQVRLRAASERLRAQGLPGAEAVEWVVEFPGAARPGALEGLPGSEALPVRLARRLVAAASQGAELSPARRVALEDLARGALDPVFAAGMRGLARRGAWGPTPTDRALAWAQLAAACRPGEPPASPDELPPVWRLALDPAASLRSLPRELLEPDEDLLACVEALLGGGGAPAGEALAAALRRAGEGAAARTVDEARALAGSAHATSRTNEAPSGEGRVP
ncbi:MAG: hypothetical protein D6731_23000 [Planctomycetota bacterium]|nr:MAG: hypothetical protein D6731_23000 [Planctomycetota bacterium]